MVSANLVADPVRPGASAIRSVSGPTRLRLADLLHVTDRSADEVLSGKYDHLVPTGGVPTADGWFARLYNDDEVDIWLISWVPGQSTELHDHGGSLGALTLLSGSLDEFRWDGERLRLRRLEAGDQAGFPLGWVHDVVWAPPRPAPAVTPVTASAVPRVTLPAALQGPTLSVHAYSPPLTVKSYYEVTDQQTLRRTHTELTDQPEKQ
ncbi:MAG: cysteine dioxygenase family protein [Mycobacterium sp.]|nr:cysteine dioxygenase family protein [Mycobacterium sp.]MBV9721948.1 cysteine dioxygenase family protein [Mycobacterium sp.]